MTTTGQSLDIDRTNVSGYCNLKCSFSFKYPETNLTVHNKGNSLEFSMDNTSQASVVFNNEKFIPTHFYITSPSIHTFNGNRTAGELVISHGSLDVCIPITQSTSQSNSTGILTEFIDFSAMKVPNSGESRPLNLSNFTLQPIVPNRPFYTYQNNSNIYIVFDYLDAITLNSATIQKLRQIIPTDITSSTNFLNNFKYTLGDLSYNSKGPAKNYIGDGIYISCRPTGSSGEDTAVTYDKEKTEYDLNVDIFNSKIMSTLLFVFVNCVALIIMLYIFNLLYGYITSDQSSKDYFTNLFSKKT